MTSFLGGALGALAVLITLRAARALAWHHRLGAHGRRHGLHHLARRLGATPDQEDVLRAEAEAVFSELRSAREDFFGGRSELAELLAAPAADPAAFEAVLERHGAKLAAARTRVAEALAKVHATLDPAQRDRLASLLRRGPRHRHGFAH